MPELPEVETIKNDLAENINGLRVVEVEVFDRRVLKDITPARFKSKLTGCAFTGFHRRGKSIIITLDQGLYLVIQVKMTGYLLYGQPPQNDTKVTFTLSNGCCLHYNDQRLFGWLIVTEDLSTVVHLMKLGVEPLTDDFSLEWFQDSIKKRKSPIKPLLLNQAYIAGIGNIYASEILFAAQVNPEKRAHLLTHKEIRKVHQCTKDILVEAVACRGTSMRNYRDSRGVKGSYLERVRVYGRDGEKCYRCQKIIKRFVQAMRSTFYCENCQKL